jgi:hypothetical protein
MVEGDGAPKRAGDTGALFLLGIVGLRLLLLLHYAPQGLVAAFG